jgi:hypothetical protein
MRPARSIQTRQRAFIQRPGVKQEKKEKKGHPNIAIDIRETPLFQELYERDMIIIFALRMPFSRFNISPVAICHQRLVFSFPDVYLDS